MKLATVMGVGVGVRNTSMLPSDVWNRRVQVGGQVCALSGTAQADRAVKTAKNEKTRSLVFGKSNLTSRLNWGRIKRRLSKCFGCGQVQVLRQGEYRDRIGGDHRYILFAVLPLISDRVRIGVARQLLDPQLFAGLRIERAEPAVAGGADEDQTARRHDGPGAPAAARFPLAFRQAFRDAERNLPRDLAGIRIHREQAAPWRFLARPGPDNFA